MNTSALQADLLGRGYRLGEALGAGGFGEVHKAERIADGRVVAIKVMHNRGGQESKNIRDLRTRFGREANVLSKLDHPGCVQLLDFGALSDGTLYMVQEFIDGWTLKGTVGPDGIDPVWATRISIQILDTLADAHHQGIVHRDVKPANIMLTRVVGQRQADKRSDVRVLDFGIAKVLDQGDDEEVLTKGLLGTPKFMAPEQARGDIGPLNDIYAVGILLVYLVTGQAPFNGHYIDVIDAHRSAPRPILSSDPLGLQPIITRALAIDPAERYPDATAMKAALEIVLRRSGHTIDDIAETVADPLIPLVPIHVHRRRRTAQVAILLLVAVLGGALALSMVDGEAPAMLEEDAQIEAAVLVDARLASDAAMVVEAQMDAIPIRDNAVEQDGVQPDASEPDAMAAEPDAEPRRDPSGKPKPRRARSRRVSRSRPPKPNKPAPTPAWHFEQALANCDCIRAKRLRARLDGEQPGAQRQRAERFYLACEPSNIVRKCR